MAGFFSDSTFSEGSAYSPYNSNPSILSFDSLSYSSPLDIAIQILFIYMFPIFFHIKVCEVLKFWAEGPGIVSVPG